MRYLPLFVDLAGRECVVIGGGTVAARKVELLRSTGARVRVVAPAICDELEDRAATDRAIWLCRRAFEPADLEGAALAFAATGDPKVQERVATEARRRNLWLNAVDDPERCTALMPAILERGPMAVAVSTGGASPALALRVRDRIAALLGDEYERAAELLGALRARFAPGPERQRAFGALLDGGLLDALQTADEARVASLVDQFCAALPPAAGEAIESERAV
jgi:siroheme synthase-like protein